MKLRSIRLFTLLIGVGLLLAAAPDTVHATTKKKSSATKQTVPAKVVDDEDTKPVDVGPVDPNRQPNVTAKSVLVMNARTGDVLYEKDADTRRPIASTTKLLTALIVAENGGLSGQVEVEPIDTVCEPTKLYFKPGESYARSSLLYALLVHSCNDVARCLARDNAGSIPAFAAKMNARAASLWERSAPTSSIPTACPRPARNNSPPRADLSHIARAAYYNATPAADHEHAAPAIPVRRRPDSARIHEHQQGPCCVFHSAPA